MDIKRSGKSKLKKRIRTAVFIVVGLAAIGGVTFGLTRLKQAAPTLERSTVVIDTVKRARWFARCAASERWCPSWFAGCRRPLAVEWKRFRFRQAW